jgi:glutaredoxin 3
MKTVEIYTTPYCPYCTDAKRLLVSKGAHFQEIDVSRDPDQRKTMVQRAKGARTVPQIFIGGQHVGGSDELHDLDYRRKLDPILAD